MSTSSDIIPRPGNPVLRERVLDAPRRSLCLVDMDSGKIVDVIRRDIIVEESFHENDTQGGQIAHQVNGFVQRANPTRRDSVESLSSLVPNWSGDVDTSFLDNFIRTDVTLPPVEQTSTPKKAAAGQASPVSLSPTSTINASPAKDTSSLYEGYTSFPAISFLSTRTFASLASRHSGPAVGLPSQIEEQEAEPNDILLDFLGQPSTIRLSRIVDTKKDDLVPVATSYWDYKPISYVWNTLSSWFSFGDRAREMVQAEEKRLDKGGAVAASRLSVIYFDNAGFGRRVWRRR